MGSRIIGITKVLSPDMAAVAFGRLRNNLKHQVWDRSSRPDLWYWYVDENLPEISRLEFQGAGYSVTAKIARKLEAGCHPQGFDSVLNECENEIGFNIKFRYNVDPKNARKHQGVYDVHLCVGRSNPIGKLHYYLRVNMFNQSTVFQIRLIKFLLGLAGYSESMLKVNLAEVSTEDDTFALDASVPRGVHVGSEIPLGMPVVAERNRLDQFAFYNLTRDMAMDWVAKLQERFASYRVCPPQFEVSVGVREWDRIRHWIMAEIPGPWLMSAFARAKERFGPETLARSVTEPGSFVPLDVIGLKGSGPIYCDAIRVGEGWRFWFHDRDKGSRAKSVLFRDKLSALTEVPDLFDRPQEFYLDGDFNAILTD